MDNPGGFTLDDLPISAAGTYEGAIIDELVGMSAASLQVRMQGGAGGAAINVYILTSLDQGSTWFDVACVAFANTPAASVVNVSGLDKVAPAAPTYLALAPGTVLDGPLGDRLQMIAVSTGAYTGQTIISGRGIAR